MTNPRARVGATPISTLNTNVTIAVWQEGVHWVSECLEFGVGSFGPSADKAAEEAMDALCSYLNTLEELGERDRIFRERSIVTYVTEPLEFSLAKLPTEFTKRAGFQLRARELPLTFA